jgi:hypothetical protein
MAKRTSWFKCNICGDVVKAADRKEHLTIHSSKAAKLFKVADEFERVSSYEAPPVTDLDKVIDTINTGYDRAAHGRERMGDDLILRYWNPDTQKYRKVGLFGGGDTFAKAIVMEVLDTVNPKSPLSEQLSDAADAVEIVRAQFQNVIDELLEAKDKAEQEEQAKKHKGKKEKAQ